MSGMTGMDSCSRISWRTSHFVHWSNATTVTMIAAIAPKHDVVQTPFRVAVTELSMSGNRLHATVADGRMLRNRADRRPVIPATGTLRTFSLDHVNLEVRVMR